MGNDTQKLMEQIKPKHSKNYSEFEQLHNIQSYREPIEDERQEVEESPKEEQQNNKQRQIHFIGDFTENEKSPEVQRQERQEQVDSRKVSLPLNLTKIPNLKGSPECQLQGAR